MPCEKLCNSFRQIADNIGDGDVIKTHTKHEISEPKLSSDGEEFGRDQFPLNLKSMRHGSELKQNVSKFLEIILIKQIFVEDLNWSFFWIYQIAHKVKKEKFDIILNLV